MVNAILTMPRDTNAEPLYGGDVFKNVALYTATRRLLRATLEQPRIEREDLKTPSPARGAAKVLFIQHIWLKFAT